MQNLSNCSFLFDGSLEIIEHLSKNYKLSIITNGLTSVQENRIRNSVIAKHFEDVVISEEISISKPNPEIFEHALKNIHHTNKNTVLMVGDSLTSDIQGGINLGIDTCWYNPNKLENNSKIMPTYEVSKFEELEYLLLNY
jgi:putative hydrolase of the HAD superfamily